MNKPTAADLVGRNMKSYLPPNKTLWILTINVTVVKDNAAPPPPLPP